MPSKPRWPEPSSSSSSGGEATSVVNHGKRQLVASEPDGHLQSACLGVTERVAHRLLDDAKGTELELGREANLFAGQLEPGHETGLLLRVGKEARERGDEPELVERWRSQVPGEGPQAVGRLERLAAGLAKA